MENPKRENYPKISTIRKKKPEGGEKIVNLPDGG